ncbi:MAG: adenylate/guanylate cyclase domain-containing protein [Betaproteobacteria bacterium]|nr:adenylate/guanylate cyclase domain-containing protein [Betaproteobacteria bacterium]
MPSETPSAPPATRDSPADSAGAARRDRPQGFFAPTIDQSGEEKLSGEMLLVTTGLMGVAAVLWVAIYKYLGHEYSVSISLGFLALSAATMAFYIRTKKLQLFAMIQLGLILFTPFCIQWTIGNFVTASGVSLWGLMAPVGAVTVLGTRQSIPWFFAWLFMTVMAGVFDFLLPGSAVKIDMQTVAVFFVLNFAFISLMIYSLLWYFASEKQKLRAQVDSQYEQLHAEKERSERLLLNVLPQAIADRLKRGESNIAQGHADVTVMFADIVGFTKMTEELSPVETVKILNDVFSMFDEIADKYGVEKIKTIGDAYMAAAGLESGAQIHYADAVANMALEMLERVSDYRQRTGEKIELRVGVGTGPVVAGVIGKKKFIYDMWGDTVNVASRMAADARAGAIQVDLTTFRRLHTRFTFDAPHEVEIKGKGRMQVHHLLSRN